MLLNSKNIKNIKEGKSVYVYGWIETNRIFKNICFIDLSDRKSLNKIEVVCKKSILSNYDEITKLLTGSSLKVIGKIVFNKKNIKNELVAEEIKIINETDGSYFLQKKNHSLETLRKLKYIRPKTKTFYSIFKIRSELFYQINSFFYKKNFIYLQSPLITSNNCESGSDPFEINNSKKNFFKENKFLSVSGQFEAESFSQAFNNCYTLGPIFRAEKSNTKTHAAEFWMLEPEFLNYSLKKTIKFIEKFLKHIIKKILLNCTKELEFLEKKYNNNLTNKLKKIISSKFKVIKYDEAIKILEKQNKIKKFEFSNIFWGLDLNKEHEKFLCKYFDSPVFIINYPKEIKSFYMKLNKDKKTVAAVDLLVDEIGELVGGSEREDNLEILLKNMEENNLKIEDYQWYLDLRKNGYIKSSGFGLGIDRLLMLLTGFENIRDVIPFPVTY